jgi:hypothetical protein
MLVQNLYPMIKQMITIFFLAFATISFAQTDDEAVRQVVTSAYVQGIHNGGAVDDIRKGFHPSFAMLRLMNNEVKPLPIEEWITNIEKSRKENGPPANKTEGKFISVDVTGTAAIVELELFRENKKDFYRLSCALQIHRRLENCKQDFLQAPVAFCAHALPCYTVVGRLDSAATKQKGEASKVLRLFSNHCA